MEQYLEQIKDIVDQLALASSPADIEDIILETLNGLPTEYDAFKTTIRNHPFPKTMDEFSCVLLRSSAC